jgi:ABC-type multidrug transport system permease subunit
MYFMADLNPALEYFFYFAFSIAVFTYALVCLAQAIAALSPSTDAATSATSLFLGLLFQFGGLLIAYPDLPRWWRWLYRLNLLSYALVSLAGPQFVPRRALCTPGLDCPTVAVLRAGTGYVQVDTQAYVSDRFSIAYDERWPCLGYLALFALGFQAVHFAATRFITHATR